MEKIILEYVPDTWDKNNTTQRRFEISKLSEEFKKILFILVGATSKDWLLSNPIILERVQNVYDYGQLLIREQFLVNLLNRANLYRVRRFIKIKSNYLEKALDYNLDYRRCGIDSIKFKKNVTDFQKDEVILIVQVITDKPSAAVIIPDVTADYFIEYIIMEYDLLQKEDEFRKENEKLEQRTKELMKKVNDVMKIQDNLIIESIKTKSDITFAKQNNFKLNKPEYVEALEFSKNDPLLIPSTVEDMGIKNANHFYKAKLKATQVEVVKLQAEIRKKFEEIRKLQEENQKFQEDKDKWFMSYNSAKNNVGKLETQVTSLNSKFQGKTGELTAVKKELEQVKKELKSCNLNCNNLEVRLTRTLEENEKLKNSLKLAKDEEKEMRDAFKKQIADLTANVKHIEKHKMELLNGFKKQLQLIDNLKKQKMHLETLKLAELSEAEYLKVLDWKWD